MAHPNLELIAALRKTAVRLRDENHKYAWGNQGSCNCGNLLQVVAQVDEKEILRAVQSTMGEWTELAEDYCGVTNAPHSLLIWKLQQIGLTPSDIHHIEYLDDRHVLAALPGGFRWLSRNLREDVIVYLETMAQLLEEKLMKRINIRMEALLPESAMPVILV